MLPFLRRAALVLQANRPGSLSTACHHPASQSSRPYSSSPPGGGGGGGAGAGDELDELIEEYSKRKPTPLTIRDLMETSQAGSRDEALLVKNGQFLQQELPVRLAHRLKDMQGLPFIVGMNPYVRSVYSLYRSSFEELVRFPPITNAQQEKGYSNTLKRLVEDHKDVIPTLSKGMIECKRYISPAEVKAFLDRKIRDRIGIRVLAEQHIGLHLPSSEGYAGIINMKLNPAELIREVGRSAQELCEINYGVTPDIEIAGAVSTEFPYITVHMEYIIFELMKNALRATVEWADHHGAKDLPPVKVTIGRGTRDITMRFSDRGGGVPYEELGSIWEYSYTTVNQGGEEGGKTKGSQRGGEDHSIFALQASQDLQAGVGGPMAGLGYGLPMSKVYAQFFEGNLDLVSLRGHGCDVFLRLNHLGDLQTPVQI